MIEINQLISIAKEASKKILSIYGSNNLDISNKSDDSPITTADLISNETIIKGLKMFSSLPILTEESLIGYEERKNWKEYWLVDPLDGTKDFIAKNDQFTINIALISNQEPIVGLVYLPVLGDFYYGKKGYGAYKNHKKIFNNSTRIDLIGSDSIFHSTPQVKSFFDDNNINKVKKYGAAIKICKLAEGVIDVYPRLNGTKEWDTAACHIIAKEAGCKLIDTVTKKELVYNKKSLKNNFFVASRNDLDFIN